MLPESQPPFVALGRFGDIMILMPGWKHIFDTTGERPVVLTSTEYGSVLDGVSYVEPWVENLHWYLGVRQAKQMALEKYGWCVCPKWWDDPTSPPMNTRANGNTMGLQIHGRQVAIPKAEWDSYHLSQWRWAGFKQEDMGKWPLVFDRRDPAREEITLRMAGFNGQPTILVNCAGNSSPFPHTADVMRLIYAHRGRFNVIDISKLRAARIFDLLGLFDRSTLLVTVDTSTLHLASASKIPMIAFIANGGGGSVVNGNCALKIRYGEWPQHRQTFIDTLNSL